MLKGSSCVRRWRLMSALSASNEETDTAETITAQSCWNPGLRRVMGGIAATGTAETAYLTYAKLTSSSVLCGADGACSSVLTGPYSALSIPGTSISIPLAALGCVAYGSAAFLALQPLLTKNTSDETNRALLAALSTAMGVFSVFLVSMLVFVLHQSCAWCFASAGLSLSLAACASLGEAMPRRQGWLNAGAGLTSIVAALVLYLNAPPTTSDPASSVLLADASTQEQLLAPPAITTASSERALKIATQLESLDTHFYGAYWCSHCYDQKQALGKQAMSKIPYIECSKDGVNAQTKLCRQKDIPGYPTWEIKGKLYPGEQALDELEEIIERVQ